MTMTRFLAAAAMLAMVVSGCECGPKPTPQTFGEVGIVYEDSSGQVITNPTMAIYDFGKVPMGTSPKLKFTVRNLGRQALDLEEVRKESGANLKLGDTLNEAPAVFDLAFTHATLGAGEIVEFDLTFNSPLESDPSVLTRDWEAVIKMRSSNVEPGTEEATITFKGTAVNGACVLPTTIDFGAVMVNDTVKQKHTINNTSPLQTTATVGEITSNSGDHNAFGFATESITGQANIPAGGARDLVLTFKPTDVHDYLALVKARASDACPEVTIKLVGSGVNSVLTCAPSPLEFGYVTPGLTVQRELTLTNQGLAPIQMTNVVPRVGTAASNEYKLLGPDTFTVPGATRMNGMSVPGELKLQLTFTPSLLGLRNGALVGTTSLAPQPMLSCPLRGQGGGPDIDIRPAGTMNFGKIPFFSTAPKPFFSTRKVTIQNLGTLPNPPDNNANLRLGMGGSGMTPWTIVAKNPASSLNDICVGGYDDTTSTCLNALPAGYDPVTGIRAAAGTAVDVPIRIQATAVADLEWDVTFHSNDPDEPSVTINVKAQAVVLPPCVYDVTPTSLNFGIVTPPQYKDLSFQIKNLGSNAGETCLITHLEMKPGSNPIFSLPAGDLDQIELQPGGVQNVTVRAWPMGSASATVQQVMGAVTFGISSPTAPQREVSLSASIATSCLTITPNDLDFGTVKKNCSSPRRTFSIYNTCTNSVTVQSYGMLAPSNVAPGTMYCPGPMPCPEFLIDGTPSFGAGTVLTSGGMPQTFALRYKPLDDGPDTGAFLIKVVQNGQTVDYVVTLRGAGDNFGQNTDTFRQDSKPKADILLVVDDSCSMIDEQAALGTNFGAFIRYAEAAGVDFHIAVIGTEINNTRQGKFIGGPNNIQPPTSDPCPGYSGPKILTPQTPNLQTQFKAAVCVGTNGGNEGVACKAIQALTAPFITDPMINGGFLRPDAVLAVVGVTDAAENCPGTAVVFENQLRNIKGAQNANLFSYNIIGPFLATPPSGCSYDESSPDSSKHTYLVNAFNGVKEELCTPSWSTALENLGKTAFGFRTNFFLTAEPDLTGGNMIVVKIDHGDAAGAQVIDPVDPRGAPVWSYDSVSNSVVFQPLFVPAPGDVMTVTYRVACF